MYRLLLLLFAALLAWRWLLPAPTVELGPGVMAGDAPVQVNINDRDAFVRDDYRITPLAEFSLRAKLLSRESYFLGPESDLSPVDFALGWGPMSDEALLEEIDISQSGRWYRWHTTNASLTRREIGLHSSNMHIIPADETVADLLDAIPVGRIIDLSGYLVRVDRDDGWRWISSLSREDSGARACELFYVKQVQPVYR